MLDLRTIFFVEVITALLSALVVASLWVRNRRHSPETVFWLAAFMVRLIAVSLVAFRGPLPGTSLAFASSALLIVSNYLLLVGLERYLGERRAQIHNYLIVFASVGFLGYFAFAVPSSAGRAIAMSLGVILILGQSLRLALRGGDSESPGLMTRSLAVVFAISLTAHTIRVVANTLRLAGAEFQRPNGIDAISEVIALTVWVALAFALFLTVNRRLVAELEKDIDERAVAEAALASSEAKFAMAFRTSPDAVNINRLSDGLYLEVNQGFTALTGFTAQDVEGRTSEEIHIWSDPADRVRLVEGLRSRGTVNNLEAEFRRKDGSVTTALMSAQVVELDGEPCILSVTRDISDRKAVEDALQESEEWHRTVLETAIDGFWLVDMDGMIIEVNEAYSRMSGYTEDELMRMRISDVEAVQKPEEIAETIRALAERGYARFESMHRRKDGTVFDVEVNVQFRTDRGGLMVAFLQDITERKRAEAEILRLNADLEQRVQERTEELTATNEELTEANMQLETATRAKSEFLASMSHELRTPLNSIIGFSDILARGMAGDLEPEQQRQTEMINASGRHLLVLVNEVLDLSAIEAGRMKLERAPVEVTVLVTQVTGALMPLALHSGLDLTWTVSRDASVFESDHTRLEQVLYNLIGNAIKFTDQGTVQLDVRRHGDRIEFVVTDTGRGISPEELTHVFDEFYQVKRRDLGKSEGTGLGLTVSRRLVEMLGGSIAVESQLGVGSTFTVRIPISGPEA